MDYLKARTSDLKVQIGNKLVEFNTISKAVREAYDAKSPDLMGLLEAKEVVDVALHTLEQELSKLEVILRKTPVSL